MNLDQYTFKRFFQWIGPTFKKDVYLSFLSIFLRLADIVMFLYKILYFPIKLFFEFLATSYIQLKKHSEQK